MKKEARGSLVQLFKAAAGVAGTPVFRIIFVYQLAVIALLLHYLVRLNISLWFIKDYILVFLTAVFTFLGTVKTSKFWPALLRSVGFSAIIQFLLGTYTFSYWIEFIIVPLIVLIVLINIQLNKTKNSALANVNKKIYTVIGYAVLAYIFWNLINDFHSLTQIDYWAGYAVEPISWIVNIPLIVLCAPLYQFDQIDSFRVKDKTSFRLLCHVVIYFIQQIAYLYLLTMNLHRYVIDIHWGGLLSRRLTVILAYGTPPKRAKQIEKYYQLMYAPEDDYLKHKKKIPLGIICRVVDSVDLIIPPYELPNLDDRYKMLGR